MENQIFTRETETIVRAAGMSFGLFQHLHGNYGFYDRKVIAEYISLPLPEYKALFDSYCEHMA